MQGLLLPQTLMTIVGHRWREGQTASRDCVGMLPPTSVPERRGLRGGSDVERCPSRESPKPLATSATDLTFLTGACRRPSWFGTTPVEGDVELGAAG